MPYNSTATKSVAAKTAPPTASGKWCPTFAPVELFVVEVEVDAAPDVVPVPVCPAAGEEVIVAVVPAVVCAAPDVETPGGTVPPGQLVGGEAVLAWTTCKKEKSTYVYCRKNGWGMDGGLTVLAYSAEE
jgi:hypothetical protein